MAKEPSAYELIKTWGLPANAKMLGWLIHLPYKDEFLVKYSSDQDSFGIWWGISPENAKAFKTLRKANAILKALDISEEAIAAPAFDIGKQIVVLTEDIGVENPMRKMTKHLSDL